MKEIRINFYLWTPRDERNYGRLCMTGTASACREIAAAVDRAVVLRCEQRFLLPETTAEDARHMGGGFNRCYRELTIGRSEQNIKIPQLEIHFDNSHVRFLLSESCAEEFKAILDKVAQGEGDHCFDADCGGRKVWVWYWPCFGHVRKRPNPACGFRNELGCAIREGF